MDLPGPGPACGEVQDLSSRPCMPSGSGALSTPDLLRSGEQLLCLPCWSSSSGLWPPGVGDADEGATGSSPECPGPAGGVRMTHSGCLVAGHGEPRTLVAGRREPLGVPGVAQIFRRRVGLDGG